MSIVDTNLRTITCNGPECEKNVTFDVKNFQLILSDNPWLKTSRLVSVEGKMPFFYCSDVCEVNGVQTGLHNQAEEKKVIPIDRGSDAMIRQAAESAKRAEEATKNLKSGQPVII